MKILYIVTDLGMGGTQAWVEYAALELVKLGHTVTVIAEKSPYDRKLILEEKGVFVHAFESPPDLIEYKQIVNRTGSGLIHLNIWERFSVLIKLRRLCNLPLVLSYHSVPRMTWKKWAARIIKPSKKQWSMYDWFSFCDGYQLIDAHIGCCDASASGIKEKFWPFMQRKVFSLPNAIPLPCRTSPEIMDGPPAFLQIGALNDRKSPLLTLRAFEKIQKSIPASSLTFVGNGPLHSELLQYARNRKIPNVTIAGEVRDPGFFYKNCNVMILPSKCEGLPYTLIEGAGHGMPLIASNVDGIPEICIDGHNGILLNSIDQNLLEKAMILFATDKILRTKYGDNGRELVRIKFDINRFINKLLRIYHVIIN